MDPRWTPEHFSRRTYAAQSPDFAAVDPRRIRLIVKVGRQVVADFQAREPGLLAFVSPPDDDGFRMEVVEVAGIGYSDQIGPSGALIERPADWQLRALGLTS